MDWLEAEDAKNAAIEAVDENAPERWKQAADEAIRDLARCRAVLTSADVIEVLEARNAPTTHELRGLGPRMTAAAKAGLIVATNERRPCGRASRHNAEVRVWRSNVWQPAP